MKCVLAKRNAGLTTGGYKVWIRVGLIAGEYKVWVGVGLTAGGYKVRIVGPHRRGVTRLG